MHKLRNNVRKEEKDMKWYEPLIWEEFIKYFSDPSTSYFEIIDGKRVCDKMLLNYYDVVNGLTLAHNVRDLKCEKDIITETSTSEYTYRAYIHFLNYHSNVVFKENWEVKFCSFFKNSTINAEDLTTEQLAVCIMYPFWERCGSNFVDNLEPKSGKLAEAVLKLLDKHNKEKE